MRLNEIRPSDFLQGTREALGDALVHPILTRRALWDSRELPRITNGYIELMNGKNRTIYLHLIF